MSPSRSLARGLLAFVLAAVAAGGATAALLTGHGEIRAVVHKAADAVVRGDAGALWDLHSTEAQFAIDAAFRRALESTLREDVRRAKSGEAPRTPRPGEPGAIGRSAVEAWADDLGRRVGRTEDRKAFEGIRVESVEVKGPRATVRTTLSSGKPQVFRLVHLECGWRLDGFEPFRAD